jgi:hypothetical protein
MLFSSVTFNKTPNKFIAYFLLKYFLKVHLNHSSKISLKKSQKRVETKVFLPFLLDDGTVWIQGVQKLMNPSDPDPAHTKIQLALVKHYCQILNFEASK